MSRRGICAVIAAEAVCAAAGVWLGLGLASPPTLTSTVVLAAPTPPVRLAADAVAGALRARDAAGLCLILDRFALAAARNDGNGDCAAGARGYADEFGESRVRVGYVDRDGPFAHVHETIDGSESIWAFRLVRGRWLLDHASTVPAA